MTTGEEGTPVPATAEPWLQNVRAAEPRNVMLAFPHPGEVRTEFMMRVLNATQVPECRIGEVAELQTGPGIGIARNKLVARFLASDLDWLLFCDTDMVFGMTAIPVLLESADPEERPVVGGLCCVIHEGEIRSTIYEATRDEEGSFAFRHLLSYPPGTLLRVDATGCGFLLVHRSAFERISKHKPEEGGLWFAEMVIDGHLVGEDLSFCMRCYMAGIAVHVHTGVSVGHMKAVQLGEVTP